MASTRNTRKKRQWPNVYSRRHRSGEVGFIVDVGLVNGKRERHSFKSKEDAESFAALKRTERLNEGTAALGLSQSARMDASKALEILAPHDVTLLQAADYYAKHVLAYRNAPLIPEIATRLIADAEKNDRRDRTVEELRSRLTAFSDDFKTRRLSEITGEEIGAWLDEDDWSPRTRINYLTKISQLFNYGLRHRWVDANIVERIERPTAEDKEPGILSLDQAASLLHHAQGHGLLPYVAIGLFAGLRSAELSRLDWSAVNLTDNSIVVGAQIAKKRSRRVVEIAPNLQAWLLNIPNRQGPLVDEGSYRENLEDLRQAAGIADWPHNALRHSFASYHLAAYGDAMKTATILGHKDPGVVHNHYKALVVRATALKFWELRPVATEEGKLPKPPETPR
jgi:integrase